MKQGSKNTSSLCGMIPDMICIGVIFLLGLRYIGTSTIPVYGPDAFAYIGNAAVMAGMPWSEIMAEAPFYSAGFSFILIPLILLASNAAALFRMIVVLNLLFICCSYYCIRYILGALFPSKQSWIYSALALLGAANVPALFFAQSSQAETLIQLLIWLSVVLFIRYEKNPGIPRLAAVYACVWYLSVVHERGFVDLLALWIVTIVMTVIQMKKELSSECRKRYLIILGCTTVFLGISLMAQWGLKQIVLDSVYSGSMASVVNSDNMSELIGKATRSLFIRFKRVLLSLGAKTLAALLATGMTVFFPIAKSTQMLKKKHMDLTNCGVFYPFTWMYVTVVFLGMFLASSIRVLNTTIRPETTVYSRYMDHCVTIMLVLGIASWLFDEADSLRRKYKWMLLLSIVAAVVGVLCFKYCTSEILYSFNVSCNAVIGGITRALIVRSVSVNLIYLALVLVAIGMAALLLVMNLIKNEQVRCISLVVILFAMNLLIFHYAYSYTQEHRNVRTKYTSNIVAQLDCDDGAVYLIKEENQDDYCVWGEYVQYVMYERPIHVLEASDAIPEDAVWLLAPKTDRIENYEGYEPVGDYTFFRLYHAE